MLIIGPLLGTVLFSPTYLHQTDFGIAEFREILRYVLLGVFATLCGIGIVILKSIRRGNSAEEKRVNHSLPTPK
jgi:H+/Cl- antiporter ClcA